MLRPTTSRRATRRGNILIVTLALLALMAVVGITAVYYTKDQAERARIQGQPKGGGEGFSADGSAAAMAFLGTFLFDTNDYGPSLLNSVRGHSLAATMYGRKPGAYVAWNGPGTFGGTGIAQYNGVDRRLAVNHQVFPGVLNIIDPEYDGTRIPTTSYTGPNPATYYGKNPPYTYPDIKDYYLASICPATGEVLVPSFYRSQVFGPLAASNPNWTSANGMFMIARPTQKNHPNFPPVPPNADGTVTGDVQNLPGGFFNATSGGAGVARYDSIWIDTGLPAFSLPNGKRVKPLIAALILDLDGRLNLSMHGNVLNGGIHSSGQGFAPWEISLEKAMAANPPTFAAEMRALVNARGPARTRAGLTAKPFYSRPTLAFPNNEIPQYAQVAWSGFTGVTPLQLPSATGTSYATNPSYLNGYSGTNSTVPPQNQNHPSLFNPNEWLGGSSPKAFPPTDFRAMDVRYAPYPFEMSKLSFAASVPTTLVGTKPISIPNPPAQSTPNQYRTDPSHANRQLFTVISNSLHRTGLMGGIVGGAPQTTDPNAIMGAIDLNRQLSDYRTDLTKPLSQQPSLSPTADTDRIQLASDIFARLVAACADSTVATVTPAGVVTIAEASPYVRSRTLAQLAVNMVDYIDNDDISTRFPWHPTDATQVVYGVEKPRLVINEAYAEVVNDAMDDPFQMGGNKTAKLDAHVRFWVELQNPTATPYTAASTAGPLGDGSVAFTNLSGSKPYVLEIVQNTKGAPSTVAKQLRDPTDGNYASNVTGSYGAAPNLSFDFTGVGNVLPANATVNTTASGGMLVLAANVPAAPPAANVPATDWLDYSYTPPAGVSPAATVFNAPAVGSANSLTYTIPLPTMGMGDNLHTAGAPTGRHVLLLRRLANPYLATGPTNPYITVDILDHVGAADRLLVEQGQKYSQKRTAGAMSGATGFEPTPQSVGKVQPYASYADPNVATAATLRYPTNSMVLPQTATAVGMTAVKQTLGRANSQAVTAPAGPVAPTNPTTAGYLGETIQLPFDWMVHMDRPLINQMELLHVSTGKPHDLTTNFVGAGGTKYVGSTQTVLLAGTFPQLYRALDLLTVQPYGHQTALGGRIPGLININTIQDKRVWDSLFDAQAGNGFDQPFVDAAWTALMASRTVNTPTTPNRYDATGAPYICPIPGATVHDTGTATGDRPFLPFGVSTVPLNATSPTFAAGVGLDDTLLRRSPTPPNLPYLSVLTGTHPYQQAEAIRKILNNTTTVSHTFAVWTTVGYFEVDDSAGPGTGEVPAPNAGINVGTFVKLGKEYYLNAPGDTRKKFFAIVDRSNIGYDPSQLITPPPAGTSYTQVAQPFFTTVEANSASAAAGGSVVLTISTDGTGNVYSNGIPVAIGSTLAIGVGANQDIVTVTAVTATSVTVKQISGQALKAHYAGECVSNMIPGNPGPQTGFDPTGPQYKSVVPLWVKLP
ncbi:MAG: hypothetical protein K8U57_17780 [Planctomycetes bacterium]|nr:hypothetical protein [Planctomycetota bacterium]